jgi:hypothetical protein
MKMMMSRTMSDSDLDNNKWVQVTEKNIYFNIFSRMVKTAIFLQGKYSTRHETNDPVKLFDNKKLWEELICLLSLHKSFTWVLEPNLI